MAMFLKLEASDPVTTAIQSTPGIPDFMDWNQLTALPMYWEPFKSLPFTVFAIFVVPALIAFIIGWAMFRRRVGGVYFAIITQAIALILSLGIDGNQGYTGGRNGITDLRTLWAGTSAPRTPSRCCIPLCAAAVRLRLCRQIHHQHPARPRAGGHPRPRGPGAILRLDVAMIRIFTFAAMLAASAARCSCSRSASCRRRFVGIMPSIEMVIFTAVGGRLSVLGAILGCLIVNFGKTTFSEAYPDLWLYLMGGTFIAVVFFSRTVSPASGGITCSHGSTG